MKTRTRPTPFLLSCLFLGIAVLALPACNGVRTSDKDIERIGTSDALAYFGRKKGPLGLGGDKLSVWVDPRTEREYAVKHIPGAISMPYQSLEQQHHQLKGYDTLIVYGDRYRDHKAEAMAKTLLELGYDTVLVLEGGLTAWEDEGNPTETGPPKSTSAS